MNSKQLSDTSLKPIVSISLESRAAARQEAPRDGLERSRKTILSGWIISMIGIVSFCLVMSKSDQQPDLTSVLAALAVILAGVGVWFAGCVKFLNEASSSKETVDW